MSDVSETVIQAIRRLLQVNQAELGAIVGVTQATVSRWERGELVPDLRQLGLIRVEATARGLAWDDAWFFVPAPQPAPAEAAA